MSTTVNPGDTVIVSVQGARHYATVLSVIPAHNEDLLGADDEPALTISYPNGINNFLTTPDWHRAFARTTPVKHQSHGDVEKGADTTFWIDVLPPAKDYQAAGDEVGSDEEEEGHPLLLGDGDENDRATPSPRAALSKSMVDAYQHKVDGDSQVKANGLTSGTFIAPVEPGVPPENVHALGEETTEKEGSMGPAGQKDGVSPNDDPLHTRTTVDAYTKDSIVEEHPSTVVATGASVGGDNNQVPTTHDPAIENPEAEAEGKQDFAEQSYAATSAPSAAVTEGGLPPEEGGSVFTPPAAFEDAEPVKGGKKK